MNRQLSILIPTKNRPSTLQKCLSSCARVESANIEFVILDNASEDSTAEASEPFLSDDRFRYLRYDARGSMSDQFCRAVEASQGDWLCIIGDDDAILPNGLDQFADRLATEHSLFENVMVVRWPEAVYRWPDFRGPEANFLAFNSFGNEASQGRLTNARELLPEIVKNLKITYQAPGIYHNFIKKKYVDYLQRAYSETIFFLAPDVSLRLHCVFDSCPYITLQRPITLAGYSGGSTGGSVSGTDNLPIRQTFWSEIPAGVDALSSAVGIDFSAFGVDQPCSEVLGTYAIFCKIATARGEATPPIENYIANEIQNARKLSPELRPRVKAVLERILKLNNLTADLSTFDTSLVSRSLSDPNFLINLHNTRFRYSMCLNLPSCLVSDVDEASIFLETVLLSLQGLSITGYQPPVNR